MCFYCIIKFCAMARKNLMGAALKSGCGKIGDITQLVRVSVSHTGSPRFESEYPHHFAFRFSMPAAFS